MLSRVLSVFGYVAAVAAGLSLMGALLSESQEGAQGFAIFFAAALAVAFLSWYAARLVGDSEDDSNG